MVFNTKILAFLLATYLLILETIVFIIFWVKNCSKIEKKGLIDLLLEHQSLRLDSRSFFHILNKNKYQYIFKVDLPGGQI